METNRTQSRDIMIVFVIDRYNFQTLNKYSKTRKDVLHSGIGRMTITILIGIYLLITTISNYMQYNMCLHKISFPPIKGDVTRDDF